MTQRQVLNIISSSLKSSKDIHIRNTAVTNSEFAFSFSKVSYLLGSPHHLSPNAQPSEQAFQFHGQ